MGKDLSSDIIDHGAGSSILSNADVGAPSTNVSAGETSHNDADAYDMFADDDDNAIAGPSFDTNNLVSGPNSNGLHQLPSGQNSGSESKLLLLPLLLRSFMGGIYNFYIVLAKGNGFLRVCFLNEC